MEEIKQLIEKVKHKKLAQITSELFEDIEFEFFIQRNQKNHFTQIELGGKRVKIQNILQIIDKKEWTLDFRYLTELNKLLESWGATLP